MKLRLLVNRNKFSGPFVTHSYTNFAHRQGTKRGGTSSMHTHLKSEHSISCVTEKTPTSIKDETEKPFKCPTCDFSAKMKNNLKQHIEAVHEGKKRYKCPSCDYRTDKRVCLKKHVSSIHEKEKTFKCSICEDAFLISSQLSSHMLVYLIETIFEV